jgi:cytoskeletal protein RodZ
MSQVRNLNNGDNSYKRKMAVRFIVLSLSAFFVSQVIPTLAEEQDRATELTAEIAPSESSPSPSPSTGNETTTAPSDAPSASATPSQTFAITGNGYSSPN